MRIMGSEESINMTIEFDDIPSLYDAMSTNDLIEVTSDVLDTYDVQGFRWNDQIIRDDYRQDRNTNIYMMEQAMNPRLEFCENLNSDCLITNKVNNLYRFHYSTRKENCYIYHFQLRHLLSCPTEYDLCFNQKVKLWNRVFRTFTDVIDLSSSFRNFERSIRVCTIATMNRQVIIGGASGDVVIKDCYNPYSKHHHFTLSEDRSNIINHICSLNATNHFVISSNDNILRVIDFTTLKIFDHHTLPWPVNCCSIHPNERVVCAVGDDTQSLLFDMRTNQSFAILKGHLDHIFSTSFAPNGIHLVTGSQDMTARVYDIRKLSESYLCLRSKVSPIRAVSYSHNSSVLAIAEADDFVSIYDISSGYKNEQVIDFFGDVSGIAFAPDTDTLSIGVASLDSGGLIQFIPELKEYDITCMDL